MTAKVWVPADSSALSVGADAVARALEAEARRRGIAIEIIRTGSRGAFWLEPLVEIAVEGRRHGFGPLRAADVPALFDAGFPGDCRAGPQALGPVDDLPWFKAQTRLTFERCGLIDPLSVDDYIAHGGYRGLTRALTMTGEAVIDAVVASGLRGRGGAGFPTGVKWRAVHAARADQKYVVCNADEGDSGTFADRLLMEGDPFLLIEGMTIAGIATGATRGYVYIRSEYPHAFDVMTRAVAAARARGWLGPDVAGSGRAFDIDVRLGAGAYICGEETALLESLEGKRGTVRAKPPLPVHHGLFGRPTIVNNLLSLCAVPWILDHGPKAYADFGMGRSRGTQPIQLAGNVARGGLIEVAFGVSLRTIVMDHGGGTLSGRPVRAVQVGGPLGAFLPDHLLDTAVDYEALHAVGGMLGHGGIVVFDDRADMAAQARFAMAFCAIESCGKCTPCRIGSTRGVEVIDRIRAGIDPAGNLALLDDLCGLMTDASLCALGGLTPLPVKSVLTHFREDFARRAPDARAAE